MFLKVFSMTAKMIDAHAYRFTVAGRTWAVFRMGEFMNRGLTLALFLISSGIALNAQTPATPGRDFTIDIPESKVEFFVGSSAANINGTFQSWNGDLYQATPGVPESATLKLEVSAATMSTESSLNDKTVKGKDFFNVKDFPTVSFASTKVIPSGDPNRFGVQGDFKLRGVSKPVTFQVTLDRDSKGSGQVYADLSFDRREFGMTKDMPFVQVSDSVGVRVDLHVVTAPVASPVKRYSWTKVIRIKAAD
jgi:polyisoprenoid-binding protein YceI